ncbi:MAG: hypothetical protein ACJ76F_05130, partial [Bacteroidia bacterium]
TYFENWYTSARPNKQWLARYDESEISQQEKLARAEQTLKDAGQFIRQSARSLFFSRTVLKYGARKLTALIGLFILAVSCTYYYFDYRSKQNDSVIQDLENRGYYLSLSDKVRNEEKAEFLVNYEHLNPGESENFLNELENDSIAFDIANEAFSLNVDMTDSVKIKPKAYRYLNYLDGRLENFLNRHFSAGEPVSEVNLKRLNILTRKCLFVQNANNKDTIAGRLLNKYEWLLNKSIHSVIDRNPDSLSYAGTDLNEAIQLMALVGNENKLVSLNELLEKLSPIDNPASAKLFKKLYPRDKITKNTLQGDKLTYNGGYYLLSLLYAAKGDFEKTQVCLDSIISAEQFSGTFYPGFIELMSVLSRNGHFPSEQGMSLVEFTVKKTKLDVSALELTKLFLENTLIGKINEDRTADISYGTIAKYCIGPVQKSGILDFCQERSKNTLRSGDELNYSEAVHYKRKGILADELGQNAVMRSFYKKAIDSYLLVSPAYLENWIEFRTDLGSTRSMPRSIYFLSQIRSFLGEDGYYNYTPAFQKYILENAPARVYRNLSNADALFEFLRVYYTANKIEPNAGSEFGKQMDYSCFSYAADLQKSKPELNDESSKVYLDLVFINKAFGEKDTAKAFAIYNRLNMKAILSSVNYTESKSRRYLVKQLAANLAAANKKDWALQILNALEPYQKRNALIDIAEAVQQRGAPVEDTFLYIDEFFKNVGSEKMYGMKIMKVISMIGTSRAQNMAAQLLKDTPDLLKSRGMVNLVKGIISNDNDGIYYVATQYYLSGYISSTKELRLNNQILRYEVMKRMKNGEIDASELQKYEFDNTRNSWGDYEFGPNDQRNFEID